MRDEFGGVVLDVGDIAKGDLGGIIRTPAPAAPSAAAVAKDEFGGTVLTPATAFSEEQKRNLRGFEQARTAINAASPGFQLARELEAEKPRVEPFMERPFPEAAARKVGEGAAVGARSFSHGMQALGGVLAGLNTDRMVQGETMRNTAAGALRLPLPDEDKIGTVGRGINRALRTAPDMALTALLQGAGAPAPVTFGVLGALHTAVEGGTATDVAKAGVVNAAMAPVYRWAEIGSAMIGKELIERGVFPYGKAVWTTLQKVGEAAGGTAGVTAASLGVQAAEGQAITAEGALETAISTGPFAMLKGMGWHPKALSGSQRLLWKDTGYASANIPPGIYGFGVGQDGKPYSMTFDESVGVEGAEKSMRAMGMKSIVTVLKASGGPQLGGERAAPAESKPQAGTTADALTKAAEALQTVAKQLSAGQEAKGPTAMPAPAATPRGAATDRESKPEEDRGGTPVVEAGGATTLPRPAPPTAPATISTEAEVGGQRSAAGILGQGRTDIAPEGHGWDVAGRLYGNLRAAQQTYNTEPDETRTEISYRPARPNETIEQEPPVRIKASERVSQEQLARGEREVSPETYPLLDLVLKQPNGIRPQTGSKTDYRETLLRIRALGGPIADKIKLYLPEAEPLDEMHRQANALGEREEEVWPAGWQKYGTIEDFLQALEAEAQRYQSEIGAARAEDEKIKAEAAAAERGETLPAAPAPGPVVPAVPKVTAPELTPPSDEEMAQRLAEREAARAEKKKTESGKPKGELSYAGQEQEAVAIHGDQPQGTVGQVAAGKPTEVPKPAGAGGEEEAGAEAVGKPAKPAEVRGQKQPWEMTGKEFADVILHRGDYGADAISGTHQQAKRSVEEFYRVAAAAGKPKLNYEHGLGLNDVYAWHKDLLEERARTEEEAAKQEAAAEGEVKAVEGAKEPKIERAKIGLALLDEALAMKAWTSAAKTRAQKGRAILQAKAKAIGLDAKETLVPVTRKGIAALAEKVRAKISPASQVASAKPAEGRGQRPEPAEATSTTPHEQLAQDVADALARGESLDNPKLTAMAEARFGGTRGQGRFTPRDAYDAMEAGINRYIEQSGMVDFKDPDGTIQRLLDLQERIARQADRTKEQVELQQFSTPPAEAFVLVLAAGVKAGDVVMEPSAGDGNIAIMARLAGARVICNEIDERRVRFLKWLGFETTSVDAEQLDNLLPADVHFSKVTMNPPFSATGGRVVVHRTLFGANHIKQALARMDEGGRLVAIVGQGMGHERPNFAAWWNVIEGRYNVRANLGLSGKHYGKFGTGFDNQIIVIDKTGPTPGANRVERLQNVVRGSNLSPKEALALLEKLAQEQHEHGTKGGESGKVGQRPVGATLPPSGRPAGGVKTGGTVVGTGRRPGGGGAAVGTHSRPVGPVVKVEQQDLKPVTPGNLPSGGEGGYFAHLRKPGGAARVGGGPGGEGAGWVRLRHALRAAVVLKPVGEGGQFAEYEVRKATHEGAVAHPSKLVEPMTMASVEFPALTYQLQIPAEDAQEGKFSDVQLEAAAYIGQQGERKLPNGKRAGMLVAAGTGVGKSRVVIAALKDRFNRGDTRAVWVCSNKDQVPGIKGELKTTGLHVPVIQQRDEGDELPNKDGLLITQYSQIRSEWKKEPKKLKALKAWLGEDFAGLIVFDESGNLQNAAGTGVGGAISMQEGSQQGQAAMDIQAAFPNARVLFVSATPATVPRNMAYMLERLGITGPGTSFPDLASFLNAAQQGGLGAMEMLLRDLKAMGAFWGPRLSYEGIETAKLEHALSAGELKQYDDMADLWADLTEKFEQAADNAHQPPEGFSQFYSAQQRFFLQLMTAYQMPDVLKAADKDLADGKAVVISLYNTNEEQTNRLARQALAEGMSLDDLDYSPAAMLVDLIVRHFPVQQYQPVTDPATGVTTNQLMVDGAGNPILNQENVREQARLKDMVSRLRLPDNPLDAIGKHFRWSKVAEISGRQERVEGGKLVKRRIGQEKMERTNELEMAAFQEGRKLVAVVSAAGSEGINLHADVRAKNQRQRVFYAAQLMWSASKQEQVLGRVHRSGEVNKPKYVLPSVNVASQTRLVDAVRGRLASMGTLSTGERGTFGLGMFEAIDLTDEYGEAALLQVYQQMHGGADHELLRRMRVLDNNGNVKRAWQTDVDKFMNRLMVLKVADQNRIFERFFEGYLNTVEQARRSGNFDSGVEQLKARGLKVLSDELVNKHESGAETRVLALEGEVRKEKESWEDAKSVQAVRGSGLEFFKSKKTGKVYLGRLMLHDWTLRNPRGTRSQHTPAEIADNFEPLTPAQAGPLWEAEVAAIPEWRKSKFTLVTGAVFPVYQTLFHDTVGTAKVISAEVEGRGRVLGIRLSREHAARVKMRFGIGSKLAGSSVEDVIERVQGGGVIELSNGWLLRESTVHNEKRIEVDFPNYDADETLLKGVGAFEEIIQYRRRWFLPTDETALPEAMGKLLKHFRAVRDQTDQGSAAAAVGGAALRPEVSLPQNTVAANTLKVGDRYISGAEKTHGEVYTVTEITADGKVEMFSLAEGEAEKVGGVQRSNVEGVITAALGAVPKWATVDETTQRRHPSGALIRAATDTETGRVTFYARNFDSVEEMRAEIEKTLVEELVHRARQDPAVAEAIAALEVSVTPEQRERVRAVGYGEGVAAEEAAAKDVADFAHNEATKGAWQRLLDAIKRWWRKLTGRLLREDVLHDVAVRVMRTARVEVAERAAPGTAQLQPERFSFAREKIRSWFTTRGHQSPGVVQTATGLDGRKILTDADVVNRESSERFALAPEPERPRSNRYGVISPSGTEFHVIDVDSGEVLSKHKNPKEAQAEADHLNAEAAMREVGVTPSGVKPSVGADQGRDWEASAEALSREIQEKVAKTGLVAGSWRRTLQLFRKSAVDTLKQAGGACKRLAVAYERQMDDFEALVGSLNTPLEDIVRPLKRAERRRVLAEFEGYMLARESAKVMQPVQALLPKSKAKAEPVTMATAPSSVTKPELEKRGVAGRPVEEIYAGLSAPCKRLVDAVQETFRVTGEQNKSFRVMVKDRDRWRAIGQVAEYWPRMMRPEIRKVLANPNRNPVEHKRLMRELQEHTGGDPERSSIAMKLLADFVRPDISDDFFAQIERGRTGGLPQHWYSHRFEEVVPRYVAGWAKRISQIKNYGQAWGRHLDLFDKTIEEATGDEITRNYLMLFRDAAYERRAIVSPGQRFMRGLRAYTVLTKLTSPMTALRNLSTTFTNTLPEFGLRASFPALFRPRFASARESGALRADLIAGWVETRDWTGKQAATIRGALEVSGFSAVERYNRAVAAAAGLNWARWALGEIEHNPQGRAALLAKAKFSKFGVDWKRLQQAGLGGLEGGKLMRAASRHTQFMYDLRQNPLWMESQGAKFLFQFQKFGVQQLRWVEQEVLAPAFRGYIVDGRRVRDVVPFLMTMALAIGSGAALIWLRELLFRRKRPDAAVEEITETAKEKPMRAARLAACRLWHDLTYTSVFGVLGDWSDNFNQFASRLRGKSPLEPPGLSPIYTVWDKIVMRAIQQGKITADDIDDVLSRELPAYSQVRDAGVNAGRLFAHTIGQKWDYAELKDARTTAGEIMRLGDRFAAENDMERRLSFLRRERTPKSPAYDELYESLLIGDADGAKRLKDEILAGTKTLDERKRALMGMKSMVRGRQPVHLGGLDAEDVKEYRNEFRDWVKKRVPSFAGQLDEVDLRYRTTAAQVGLMASPEREALEERTEKSREQYGWPAVQQRFYERAVGQRTGMTPEQIRDAVAKFNEQSKAERPEWEREVIAGKHDAEAVAGLKGNTDLKREIAAILSDKTVPEDQRRRMALEATRRAHLHRAERFRLFPTIPQLTGAK